MHVPILFLTHIFDRDSFIRNINLLQLQCSCSSIRTCTFGHSLFIRVERKETMWSNNFSQNDAVYRERYSVVWNLSLHHVTIGKAFCLIIITEHRENKFDFARNIVQCYRKSGVCVRWACIRNVIYFIDVDAQWKRSRDAPRRAVPSHTTLIMLRAFGWMGCALTVKAIPTVAEKEAILNSFIWYLTINDVFPTPESPSNMTYSMEILLQIHWIHLDV